MENEVLIAENVKIDMEALIMVGNPRFSSHVRFGIATDIVTAIYRGLSPEDRRKLEEYRKDGS